MTRFEYHVRMCGYLCELCTKLTEDDHAQAHIPELSDDIARYCDRVLTYYDEVRDDVQATSLLTAHIHLVNVYCNMLMHVMVLNESDLIRRHDDLRRKQKALLRRLEAELVREEKGE